MDCHNEISLLWRRKGPWSSAEDGALMRWVEIMGDINWVAISRKVRTRNAKQCRERYHQNLKPGLNHDPITPKEAEFITAYVHEFGKQWAMMARFLPGRSDNAIKNWWNGMQNRARRQQRRQKVSDEVHHCRPLQDDDHDMNDLGKMKIQFLVT